MEEQSFITTGIPKLEVYELLPAIREQIIFVWHGVFHETLYKLDTVSLINFK
jgi:hypothetical protein